MDMWAIALRVALAIVVLRVLVWWLEPRMAFFPTAGHAAAWGVAEAEGFIRLFGMSSTLWAEVNRK